MRFALSLIGIVAVMALIWVLASQLEGCSRFATAAPAPRCTSSGPGDFSPRTPATLAAAITRAFDDRLLIRDDDGVAIIDADGLLFLMSASDPRAPVDAILAALSPLPEDVRAAIADRTVVIVWVGRGHGDQADPLPRPSWEPRINMEMVHEDLTDTGCLVRVETAAVPGHSRNVQDRNRVMERATHAEAPLLEALAHPDVAPFTASDAAQRRDRAWKLLHTSGIWAERQTLFPPVSIVLIVVLLLFFGRSITSLASVVEMSASTLKRMGALVVPAMPGGGARVVTYGLLHTGLMHLVNNCFSLWLGGMLLAPALGTARTLIVFLVGVLAAGVVRRAWKRPGVMAGASGGAFAFKGAALALVFMPGPWLPVYGRSGFLILFAVLLGMGILTSFLPSISLLGHLAGAAGGALLVLTGIITLGHPTLEGGVESGLVSGIAWAIAGVALLGWIGAGAWTIHRAPPATESEEESDED